MLTEFGSRCQFERLLVGPSSVRAVEATLRVQ